MRLWRSCWFLFLVHLDETDFVNMCYGFLWVGGLRPHSVGVAVVVGRVPWYSPACTCSILRWAGTMLASIAAVAEATESVSMIRVSQIRPVFVKIRLTETRMAVSRWVVLRLMRSFAAVMYSTL